MTDKIDTIPGLTHFNYLEKIDNSQKINRICLSINGSLNKITSFNLTLTEILPYIKNRELIACHIFNSEKDSEYNWRFQKNTILEKFLRPLERTCIYPNRFYLQDKKYPHNIEQINQIAQDSNSLYFITDYDGLKEQNLKPENLKFSIDYLFSYSNKIPTILFKDDKFRKDKENKEKGYIWLVLLDKDNIDCMKALEFFIPLIDRRKDIIYAYVLIPSMKSDNISDHFLFIMEKIGFVKDKNCFVNVEYFEKSYFKLVKEYVNNNDDIYFDFVLFYNNPEKYALKRNENYKLATELKANIGFVNVPNIKDFDYDKIADFHEIGDFETENRLIQLEKERQEKERQKKLKKDEKKIKKKEPTNKNVKIDKNKNKNNNNNKTSLSVDSKINNDEKILLASVHLIKLPKFEPKIQNRRYLDNIRCKSVCPISLKLSEESEKDFIKTFYKQSKMVKILKKFCKSAKKLYELKNMIGSPEKNWKMKANRSFNIIRVKHKRNIKNVEKVQNSEEDIVNIKVVKDEE